MVIFLLSVSNFRKNIEVWGGNDGAKSLLGNSANTGAAKHGANSISFPFYMVYLFHLANNFMLGNDSFSLVGVKK